MAMNRLVIAPRLPCRQVHRRSERRPVLMTRSFTEWAGSR